KNNTVAARYINFIFFTISISLKKTVLITILSQLIFQFWLVVKTHRKFHFNFYILSILYTRCPTRGRFYKVKRRLVENFIHTFNNLCTLCLSTFGDDKLDDYLSANTLCPCRVREVLIYVIRKSRFSPIENWSFF